MWATIIRLLLELSRLGNRLLDQRKKTDDKKKVERAENSPDEWLADNFDRVRKPEQESGSVPDK